MPPAALTRIHSILKHAVAMRDADVEIVVQQMEAILVDESFTKVSGPMSSDPRTYGQLLPAEACCCCCSAVSQRLSDRDAAQVHGHLLTPDGWLPIASLLNYTQLGATVWPFGGVGVVADCLNARGSMVVELSGDSSCVRKRPLRVQARTAIEWIFSDMNYHKDVHLQLLQDPNDGFVDLRKIVDTYSSVGQIVKNVMTPEVSAVPPHVRSRSSLH